MGAGPADPDRDFAGGFLGLGGSSERRSGRSLRRRGE
jgi:hypothetical protein